MHILNSNEAHFKDIVQVMLRQHFFLIPYTKINPRAEVSDVKSKNVITRKN